MATVQAGSSLAILAIATMLFSSSLSPRSESYLGTSTRSGTTGLISNTAFNKSLTTLSCPFEPWDLISFILDSASLLASSSAFLLPLVCWGMLATLEVELMMGGGSTSDSNFLNSSSFSFRYASTSFFASSLASFTFFVRSVQH